ncbi:MAG: XRE family transcriptional regulator [Streptomycetaceae bacterium]|nr:XRE family transcriptional regulator [Streptomycetaceae bacterium]
MRTEQRRGVGDFDPRRLQLALARADMSPRALATAAGVTVTVLGQYERGERAPEHGTLQRLADSLGCTVGDLRTSTQTTLRDLRSAAGVSQQAASAAAGMTRSTYAMAEQGRTKSLSAAAIGALADLFGTTPDAVTDAHAGSVSAHATAPAPLVLEGQLLEGLAAHFGVTSDELLALARGLVEQQAPGAGGAP